MNTLQECLDDSYDKHDGRPKVGWYDDDPLLDALVRAHPELIPLELLVRLQADRGRVGLASASAAAGGPPTP